MVCFQSSVLVGKKRARSDKSNLDDEVDELEVKFFSRLHVFTSC